MNIDKDCSIYVGPQGESDEALRGISYLVNGNIKNSESKTELEIYKKIAKLLSRELIQYAELLEKDYGCYSMFAYNSPKEVIKWARKEVEDENT